MAKISMKKSKKDLAQKSKTTRIVSKTSEMRPKNKVRKASTSHFSLNANRIVELATKVDAMYDGYWDNAPEQYWNEKESNLYNGIENKMDELVNDLNAYIELLEFPDYTQKSKKPVTRNADTLLKKGWKVVKAEDEKKKEEKIEDVPEPETEDNEDAEEVTEEITEEDSEEEATEKAKKMAKKDPYKAMYAVLKSKGWVLKSEDEGPDSEDLEEEVLGDKKVVEVPETPEPTENVEETETGIPEEPPLPKSEDNETPTEEDGNDMTSILPKNISSLVAELGDSTDDLEEMIDKKRMEKEDGVSLSTIGGMQPFKNNYRTTQMGEGKMDALSQMKVTVGKK